MLESSTRLGVYEVRERIGAGGMGEVYRARDQRIGREVAVKVLPAAYAADPDRVRRFEQEARAAGALNHPNVLTIYDVGRYEDSPYIVCELLVGETLRKRMAGGALPARKAVEYGLGIARGLAAAHEQGIVHRDLKPENIFVTADGRVKILDFGLAKLTHTETAQTETEALDTAPGAVLGTVGYMSPEQVRGRPADPRSDIFAFGAILYEMLAGRAAFRRETVADTVSAIVAGEPPPADIVPALDHIVRHCLEKSPAERFQSARDIAFDLEVVTGTSSPSAAAAARPTGRRYRLIAGLAAAVLLGAALFAAAKLGQQWERRKSLPPVFHQLTFRRGGIQSARFAPDEHTIVYAASWEGGPVRIHSTRPESPESRPLDLPDADVLAISISGEMAIALHRNLLWWAAHGTLARVPLAGSAPREILEHVQNADWSPDGSQLAVVRQVGGRYRLEFPIGRVLYETADGLSHARVSPQGDRIALIDHPIVDDDAGFIAIIDTSGKRRVLTAHYESAQGLAWAPSGAEVWYTAAEVGSTSALHAVTISEPPRHRIVTRAPGRLVLHDISPSGQVLLAGESFRSGVVGLFPGEARERDLSWLDLSLPADLSPDGKTLLIGEQGAGGGPRHAVYLRRTDGSAAVNLGEGAAAALSPDGKWALSLLNTSPQQLRLLPTGAGEARTLPRGSIESSVQANWLPDGKRVVFDGREPGHGPRLWVQDLSGGKPRPISPEGVSLSGHAVSPDGQLVVGLGPAQDPWLCRIDGGEARLLTGGRTGDRPLRWSADGQWVYFMESPGVPQKVVRLAVSSGRRELWKQITPTDPAGFVPFYLMQVTPDGKYYCYTYARILADLYLVTGLK